MKKILTLILITSVTVSFAQKKQKDTAKVRLPLKDGSMFFERIIDSLPGQTKNDLYDNSLKWLAENFVDSKEVIQIKDKDNGNIVGTGIFDFKAPGFAGGSYKVSFMVDITAKDNKTRLRLYKFQSKSLGNTYYGSNKVTPDGDYRSMDKGYIEYLNQTQFPKENRNYYQALRDKIVGIIDSYKSYLTKNLKKDDF